jgi:hypothetical protein
MLVKLIEYMPSPFILFCISSLILIFNFTRKNNNFFDIRSVFKGHFKIFINNKFQFAIFFLLPLMLALAIIKIKLIDKDIVNNINIVLAIFISMFFAMLGILCSLPKKDSHKENGYNKLLKETFNTIIFECVLCITILIISFVQLFIDDYGFNNKLIIVSLIVYYLILVVVLNIFMVIKRLKKLFDER